MTDEEIVEGLNDFFESRCMEVQKYFEFLERIDSGRENILSSKIDFGDIDKIESLTISRDIIKTLRANGYLLLYNLVESTMTNAIDAIHKKLDYDDCGFDELSVNLKSIVISNFRKASDGGVVDILYPIHRAILNIGYKKDKIFSGNLDSRLIRTTADKYGFSIAQHDHSESRGGANLLTIKTKRNELAHGTLSFEECGQFVSIDELYRFFREAKAYLQAVLKGIEEFILGKKYRV